MSNKFVKDVVVTLGRNVSRVTIMLQGGTEVNAEQARDIGFAAEHIIGGRQIVLSGNNIEVHGNISVNNSVVNNTAAAAVIQGYKARVAQLEELLKIAEDSGVTVSNLLMKAEQENDRLQAIIDGVDSVFKSVHDNSTRGKQKQEVLNNLQNCGIITGPHVAVTAAVKRS